MGFTAVLLSPVFKSRSHGYDGSDYFVIDNRLGTNDEFNSLVKKFHENGIRVILDSVFNHCGRDFFAFQELRQTNRGYADWFSGVDFNKQSPMGDPFNYNTWNGHYELPKFNLHNTSVKDYLFNAARFWVDTFDIDGMRLDAADVLDFGFMTELRRVTEDKKPDFWLMGEVVHGDYRKWVSATTLHSVTNYILYKSLISSHNDNNLYELAYCVIHSVPDNGLPLNTFLDNHDLNRIASCTKPEHLNSLYTLLYTLPGIPSVYYGSEWGVKGVKQYGSDQDIRPYINIENRAMFSSLLTGHISMLARIRHSENALKYGGYKQVYLEYNRPFVFERSYENERIYIAVNVSDKPEMIDLSEYSNSGFLDLLLEQRIFDLRHIQLEPHTARILKQSI
jgi:glycosidase